MNAAAGPLGGTMMDAAQAARMLAGTLHGASAAFCGVTTDSRTVAAGDLFVALKGERFDGHGYVAQAASRGAVAALVERVVASDVPIAQVVVDDTRLALGRLAGHWRGGFDLPLVALTGSNGKTTVKEMLAAILAAHCGAREPVLATLGNLNNDIGMPLTLLRLRPRHRFAVIEMGMNHAGEIEYLTRIAAPTVALVNNAQRAHVGPLGSVDAIAAAKGEIYSGLRAGGVAVVNADDAFASYWADLNRGRPIVTFGLANAADVGGAIAPAGVRISTPTGTFEVALRVDGEHNVRNALAAFEGVPGRLQRRRARAGAWLLDDSYNANPESMKAAIDVLAAQPGRRVFVMGDMGELGTHSEALHAEVGDHARRRGVQALLTFGAASRHAGQAFGAGARHFDDIEALRAAALAEARAGTTLLVKGSRFMQMERVADALAAPGDGDAV